MFPDVTFLGIDLYTWMMLAGVLVAIFLSLLLSDRVGLSVKLYRFMLVVTAVSIIVGYLSAVLFQSFYDYLETGVFKWGSGATFYGGLIGAAVVFLTLYFSIGHVLFRDREHIAMLPKVVNLAFTCIVLAHAIGRIGCLFAGCCYGAETDVFGSNMYAEGVFAKRVPTQLLEAIFLFLLFGLMVCLLVGFKNEYVTSAYLIFYGVWRFLIEYLRADDRGASGISFLQPSQLTAIVLVLLGVALAVLYRAALKKQFLKLEKQREEVKAQ